MLLLLLTLVLILYVWLRRRRKPLPIKHMALRELARLESDFSLGPQDKLLRLSILMRRTSLSLFPREQVAGLQGEAWLSWLDQGLSDGRFLRGPGRWLLDQPYRPTGDSEHPEVEAEPDLSALFELCREWLSNQPEPRKSRPRPRKRRSSHSR